MERSADRVRHALSRDDAQDIDSTGQALAPAPYQERFLEAMDDDLNTPRALAVLFDLARDINRCQDSGGMAKEAQAALRHLGGILGVTFTEPSGASQENLAAKPFIELLLDTRAQLRKAKEYSLADQIRQGLELQGVVVEDTAQGTNWEYRPHRES